MVGKLTATKPSRSDEILDGDEQVRITNQIRSQFDDLAPKRPIKPNRSEPDAVNPVDSTNSVQNIPELDKFEALRSRSHVRIISLSFSATFFSLITKDIKRKLKNFYY